MSAREMVKILYTGGQAAILAELVVIFGIFMVALGQPDLVQEQVMRGYTTEAAQGILDLYADHQTMFILVAFFSGIAPNAAMLAVIWTFHHYFAWHGVHLLHWIGTSLALLGVGMSLASTSIQLWGLAIFTDALSGNTLANESFYMGFIIAISLQLMGITLLYFGYPFLLVLTAWRDKLLPYWFMALMIVFSFVHDITLGLGLGRYSGLVEGATILFPFLVGVVLLRKAQALAREVYESDHGMPPTPTPPTSPLNFFRTRDDPDHEQLSR